MNRAVKFREQFRPFAPAVLEEEIELLFDMSKIHALYPKISLLYVDDSPS